MANTNRVRTLNFLPEIFQTTSNQQFLSATLDQLVNPPNLQRIQGYIGSKFGYGVNPNDYYVTEPTKTRREYQLDPGVVIKKTNENTAKDFITYPGILDALNLQNGVTNNNNRLFNSQFYSWDSFTNLDKIINFNQYYWLPFGPPSVTVASQTVYSTEQYVVTSLDNGYNIRIASAETGEINPTLTLLRGGTYTFLVDQDTQFWIQGQPGVTGYSPTQTNLYTRNVYGVENNGATQGYVTFTVPAADAQNEYQFPASGVNLDLVCTTPFSQINGQLLSTIGAIDGVTSLQGLQIMFYNTGIPNETGYVQTYYSETSYDTNDNTLVQPLTISVNQTAANVFTLASGTNASLNVNDTITFNNPTFGGVTAGSVYFINGLVGTTGFTISATLGGSILTLTNATGLMTANTNQGLLEEGYYTTVANNFYTVEYVGDPANPVIRLIPSGVIPTNQTITPAFGVQYNNLPFYRNTVGTIAEVPYISAPLNTLYYQDGTNADSVGVIKLIESNLSNTINVTTDILGQKTFTSTNGVVFTNGLKVSFDGDVIPTSYLSGEYYVEGVGTAIELIPVNSLICPEGFTEAVYNPYDSTNYDIGNWDLTDFVPVLPDYITIARNSINKNAWSRSNRWFHIDVINATASYNNDPTILTIYASATAKAQRPIIEFYPNLQLFNSGIIGKQAVDFFDTRTTDALTQVADQQNYYPDIQVYSTYTATVAGVTNATSTTITINASAVTGTLQQYQYITDSTNLLPRNSQIQSIALNNGVYTLNVSWQNATTFNTTTVASIVASDTTVNNYALFSGARVIFSADPTVSNTIFVVNLSTLTTGSTPVITMTPAEDSPCLTNEQVAVLRGYYHQGESYYYTGTSWDLAQEKTNVNQAPYFDMFDSNGVSFGDPSVYHSTTFTGTTLFQYGVGIGSIDTVLGFPISYSSIDNQGDIQFDVTLNSDTFNYVNGATPITENINTGYVYNYTVDRTLFRQLGWQTAVAPSVQYQYFEIPYSPATTTYTCDIAALTGTAATDAVWPVVQVYIDNVYQSPTSYTYTVGTNSTTIVLPQQPSTATLVQILLLSNQVSTTGYYQIPINLSNNPLNTNITVANVGDIRNQYQSIFYNNPNTTGQVFGPNNYRDLGDIVPYGTAIIQNSASLVLPGALLRVPDHNLFNALLYNSREYVNYKQLIVSTVSNTNFTQTYNPAQILDIALAQITQSKSPNQSFFWSDMIPSQAPYRSNIYTFNNALDTSIYPLSQVYNFETANYNGVLVYRTTKINDYQTVTEQLIKGQDYTVSTTAPSLEVTIELNAGDTITINEYNQTYGSYAPNTPTKLGLYPAFVPEVVLDSDYYTPTYFIKGHDGSFTKLYGEYINGVLQDYRDQALLEFETRVYNNLKLSNTIPIQAYDLIPGYFRQGTQQYSNQEWLEMYSTNFLNWIGQNRLNYKTQYYNTNDPFSYNYTNSGNKLDSTPIQQGYWRGVYQYFYDTTTPNETPWEMLYYPNQPSWWTERYGPAPYTSDNLVLWNDIANGVRWEDGVPVTVPELARPGLLNILPVDSAGNLVSPFVSIVGNYNPNTFQKDWVVGDDGPTELSYRRSSTWPFDFMRLQALMKPAEFFNLGVWVDNYKYNAEFNQYLVNDRSHLVPNEIPVYGSGTAVTSYLNWIVDFEKQQGIDATTNLTTLFNNLDVRLVYRLAGFSDQNQLAFYVEKASPNTTSSSLLIPNESYNILLYDNQPFDRIPYSSVVVQQNDGYYTVFGNAQQFAYFTVLNPVYDGQTYAIDIQSAKVKVAKNYSTKETIVPYGTSFYSTQELAQFLTSYGAWLQDRGMIFQDIQNGLEVTWNQMVAEFLYWSQTGWGTGSVITLNPAATLLTIDKVDCVVQPLTIQDQNFVLNQNLYPIQLKDMCIERNDTQFTLHALNQGDAFSYAQFDLGNFEHGIVFDNTTQFNDTIYNLVTGLRQIRINVRGAKTADWNGTVNAWGFILNQDNVQEWSPNLKYTKGQIVLYKNKYWVAQRVIEPTATFNQQNWKETNYNAVQIGMLPNPSTRSFESALYYNTNVSNLSQDANLLSYSLIGYRPRDYLATADLTDVTQINVYQNLIKNKGTRNAVNAFQGVTLPQGGISYNVYENWAILQGEFGGVANNNFVQFRINQANMTGDPSIFSLTNGVYTPGSMQEIPIYSLYNYKHNIDNPNILLTTNDAEPSTTNIYPDAGYVNFNDVKMSSYFYSGLPRATDITGQIVPIQNFYVRDYVWLANFLNTWNVYSLKPIGQVIQVRNNLNKTATITFAEPHGLSKLQPLAIVNFANNVDGYYIVTQVVNLNEVIINLNVATANQNTLTGQGIGLIFETQRAATPSEIGLLDLTEADFITNTVWVDENTDGNWAVYQKTINYQYNQQLEKPYATNFGTAVSYSPEMGYLVSDAPQGNVYRYVYDPLSSQSTGQPVYDISQTLTGGTSFGTTIVHQNNIYAISEPTSGTPKVYIYALNDSTVSTAAILYQTIAAPGGVTNWGSALAMSGDNNWLYISDIANNNVYVYRREQVLLNAGYFVTGQTYTIQSIGTTDFTAIGAVANDVGITFVATGAGTGTGTALQVTYAQSTVISGSSTAGSVSGDNFSASLSTDYYGQTLFVGAPDVNYSSTIENWGSAYAYQRTVQNVEAQQTSVAGQIQSFTLGWTPTAGATRTASATNGSTNYITCNAAMTGFAVNQAVVFNGSNFANCGIKPNVVYYIAGISGSTISIKTSRSSTTPVQLTTASGLSFGVYVQVDPLYVTVNGTLVQDNNYGVIGNQFVYSGALQAGDIINISDNQYTLVQNFNSQFNDRTGIHYGYAMDMNTFGTEVLVGSPFEINDTTGEEGATYRYTNVGAKYGVIIGTSVCNLLSSQYLFINGYLLFLTAGDATSIANQINSSKITNVQASVTTDGMLVIQVIDSEIAQPNNQLSISVVNEDVLDQLGLDVFVNTQVLVSPYAVGPTEFGTAIKFNESGSVVISAPVGTRYEFTSFDFTDNGTPDLDTVFDNNATRFVDSYPNAGAVYMYDYLGNYNENVANPGQFVFAQSVNSQNTSYGFNPLYGASLDFNNNTVVVGSPDFLPGVSDGQVVIYDNSVGTQDWGIYRQSAPIVDINSISNSQLFSATSNNTLVNLDYIDPLQGKILGSVRQNLDFVTNTDPARYNSDLASQTGYVWGANEVGKTWFNTNNVRFVNYHQNDVVYNSKYWGQVFPGSDVAVYTWVASNVPPQNYQGPGTPLDITLYAISSTLNASSVVVPIYYFWVRNTNLIFSETGKTLSDTILAQYIANPRGSGISFMAPVLPNTFAVYNSLSYFNGTDTVFNIAYSSNQDSGSDIYHQQFALIKENYAEDFLPGFPQYAYISSALSEPNGLYLRFINSLAGCDDAGGVVPDPYLPIQVQSGVQVRPRQSFFLDRFLALKNYLTFANEVLAQYPIVELRENLDFLYTVGDINPGTGLPYYDTTNYWEFVNWWAPGYSDNTRSVLQVPLYADLATLNVSAGTIVTVAQNGAGKFEVYITDGLGNWTRIGLQQGTIQFSSALWDYSSAGLGWDGNFFDTNVFDLYPSEETRYIVRALNEQIYTADLLIYRNQSLILLFQYIQSETTSSQNFLPWLNKTSLVDVDHKIRELLPLEVYQGDNEVFLEGYLNEVKPYHVTIKQFSFSYTGNDVFEGNITDFDLPAQWNNTYQEFISPELVYTLPNNEYEYLPSSSIWQTEAYNQWYQNYGVSLTGQDNYNITTLVSYLTPSSKYIIVDNANGFPINGTITIDGEQIGYSSVDRALNQLSGLVRGYNSTVVTNHIPGAKIYIDLPAVLLLSGGNGYSNPPRVTAVIDETLYPAPRTPAVLEAVMNLDSVLEINVIIPGSGYPVLPTIVIEPSSTIYFANTQVNSVLHTITVYAPDLVTGSQVQYFNDTSTNNGVGELADGQWYYINVLETTPTAVVALYVTYSDAINDANRIPIFNNGTGSAFSLNLGARASAISTAYPVRENSIRMKFDRTTYNSQVQDWQSSAYYGAFFAGSYRNNEDFSSSDVSLESTTPPIQYITAASGGGVVFEISDVTNDQQVEWSSFVRYVGATVASNNSIKLIPQDGNNDPNNPQPNASGTTVGFYVGMPIQFNGVGIGGLVGSTTSTPVIYYVHSIIDELYFTVSLSVGGPIVTLTYATVGAAGLECLTASVTNTAVLTVNYPGIITVTNTTAVTNVFTAPVSAIGTGGTNGFYVGIPLFFTEGLIGGVVLNQVYYVSTIIDEENFTISSSPTPLSTTVLSTASSTNIVTVYTTEGMKVNDPLIFNNMVISGSSVTDFGNIISGVTYYIKEIINSTEITISQYVNSTVFPLTTVAASSTTSALVTDQSSSTQLTTGLGAMIMNVNLPISPGQINGQLFNLYETSGQYPNIGTGVISELIGNTVNATIQTVNYVAFSNQQPTQFMYANMPVRFNTSIGGLSTNTTYYIKSLGVISVNCTTTSSSTNQITCNSTSTLYVGMPIKFSGVSLGGITIGQTYFVKSIVDSTHFTISATSGGSTLVLFTSNGEMVGTGDPYMVVSATLGGSAVSLTSSTARSSFVQYPTANPTFDISYAVGGYIAIINSAASGFAVNNVITIYGSYVGGTTPTNNVTLTVNTIGTDGQITGVIASGTVPASSSSYYLKVVSPNQLAVYSNPLLTVPVSGLDIPYVGFTVETVTGVNSSTNALTIADTTQFSQYDAVVFTGNTSIAQTNIVPNQTYYIYQILSPTTFTISTAPGDGSTVVTMVTTIAVNFTMAKAGSFAVLPQPFYFNQSIVKYNNRIYQCIISNNDSEFIFGKWQLLDSDSNLLNAMDRVIGYYQPTANMPGVDLTQLFEGVTYPNSTYYGNQFAPANQYPVDTILQDQPFYPTEVDITSVIWNGATYLATSNLPTYSAVLISPDGINWSIDTLANINVDITDILYAGGFYVITTTNSATPIYRSNDGINWTTNGYYTPYSDQPYDTTEYDSTSINVAQLALQAVTYSNGYYIAVGDNIVRSADTYNWVEVPIFPNTLTSYEFYAIANVTLPSFTGLIAVGSGLRPDVTSGVTEQVSTNVIFYSTNNGLNWTQVNSLTPNGFYGIAGNNSLILAVGSGGVIYYSTNGASWLGLNQVQVISINAATNVINVTNSAGFVLNQPVRFSQAFGGLSTNTTYYIVSITGGAIKVSLTPSGSAIVLTNVNPSADQTMMFAYNSANPNPATLRDIIYANGIWITVGDTGTIKTSTNGFSWTTQSSGTVQNLHSVTYNNTTSTFTVVGDNNTILESTNNGVSWSDISVFNVAPTVYDVQGAEFPYGYGPEELVPGVVTDSMAMTVITRPGTLWPVVEYSNAGYNSVSLELTPTSASQTVYSFASASHYPAQVRVQVLDSTTMLGTTLDASAYTVDWINKSITLNTPLSYLPNTQKLRIDVYEVGNGSQLVKSNTDTNPIRNNTVTGFDEIYLDCNYSQNIYSGSGVIQQGTYPINTLATETFAETNYITCASISNFILNTPITFLGNVFGGIVAGTQYYVKSISTATNQITISATYNSVTGQAGPTLALTTATGSMDVAIEVGNGLVWTAPIVYLNGTQLVMGVTNNVIATTAGTNAITTNSTSGLIVGTPIMFSSTIFGGVIQPLTTYYISSIIDIYDITISATLGGPTLALTNANGGASFVTNDYAFGIQPNGIQAKMIFSSNTYNTTNDYIVYSVFGQTEPVQIGYSLPTVQEFIATGQTSSYNLNNYLGGTNAYNAIVEIDGVRQTISQYTISEFAKTINFVSNLSAGSKITVTTFNDTQQQYLTTQYGITGTPGSQFIDLTVGSTTHTVVTYDQGGTAGFDSNGSVNAGSFVVGTQYEITTVGTTNWVAIGASSNNVGIVFTATGVGSGTGVALAVGLYAENYNYLTLSSGTTASLQVNNSLVFSDVIGGIVAGKTYYVTQIINSTQFVISELVGGEPLTLTNATGSMLATANGLTVAPISNISNQLTAPLAVTFASATTSGTNAITVTSTNGFVVGRTAIFQGTGFGGIVTDGTVYFVDTVIDDTNFTIMDQYGNQISLSNGSGDMQVTIDGQPAIRVTTSIDNYFNENQLVNINGTQGSVQLNGNTYYARIITNTTFDLYTQPYDPSINAVNYPVTTAASWTGGGYAWRSGVFVLSTTTATATTSTNNIITVADTSNLVQGTPILFNEIGSVPGDVIMGGLVQGTTYYVGSIFNGTEFNVTSSLYGSTVTLTNDSGSMNVVQWVQSNVDRLWVTVNGLRVPSSNLSVNQYNEVGILTEIVPGDEVIITNMIPQATPNELTYLNLVNTVGEAVVYRANTQTRTWLTQPIYDLSTTIYVNDVTRITTTITENATVPAEVDGYYYVGLNANKNSISSITVFDTTTNSLINSSEYELVIVDTAPQIKINGTAVSAGNSLVITILEGNVILVNGEQIKFTTVDFVANSISGLQRGANGTARQPFIPTYTEVYGLLPTGMLSNNYYNQTWNSYVYNQTLGDPLQISNTVPAEFLNTDVT